MQHEPSDRQALLGAYFDRIEKAGIGKKYQMDIYVGDAAGAPPANEAHFILEDAGLWTVSNWSRGKMQDASVFATLGDALDYSYDELALVPEFRRAARHMGYDPPLYEFDELVEAFEIALRATGVRLDIDRHKREITVANGAASATLHYAHAARSAAAEIVQSGETIATFDTVSNALSFLYWRFFRTDGGGAS